MKRPVAIAFAVLIILQILTYSRIGALQSELQNTRNQLAGLTSQQSSQISNIYNRIDNLMKSQASIIDSLGMTFGQLDPDALTVPVTVTVTPKELTAGTQASLQIADEIVPMTRNGATFKATASVGIFKPLQAAVMLSDGDVQRTERLPAQENLHQRLLPSVFVMFEGGESGYVRDSGSGTGSFQIAGRFRVEAKPAEGNPLQSARLVVDIDGQTVSEKPLVINESNELKERFSLTAGQKLTMTVIATDQVGLTYRSVAHQFALDGQANPAKSDGWFSPEASVFDKSGKMVWSPKA